jgi:hypothetical protein
MASEPNQGLFPAVLAHPTAGQSTLEPSRIAIRWRAGYAVTYYVRRVPCRWSIEGQPVSLPVVRRVGRQPICTAMIALATGLVSVYAEAGAWPAPIQPSLGCAGARVA